MRSRFLVLSLLAAASQAPGQFVWQPAQGKVLITPSFYYDSFRGAYGGGPDRMKLASPVVFKTTLLGVEYGLTRNIALDATAGFVANASKRAFGSRTNDAGMTDTSIGVRWRLYSPPGRSWAPSVGLRTGGVIHGTYRTNLPYSSGDGADAADASLLMGKTFGESGWGTYADGGYRVRNRRVPDEIFASAGVFKNFGRYSLSGGVRSIQTTAGFNLFDPGFTFPRLKERNRTVEGGISRAGDHNVVYQIFVAKTVEGRNTGDRLIVGMAITFGL
ncbi:MAG: hypothetical protein FJW20_23785 [Acidimicrobiia bacterium]|nr:hypothetical protein [Acidimicrobiia bacterium]